MSTQVRQVTLTVPILRKGTTGYAGTVGRLQQMLNTWVGIGEKGSPAHPIQEDGEFGPETEAAVKTFQGLDYGTLTVDGIVGRETWTKLLQAWVDGRAGG